jgi:hypothetical protein
MNIFKTFEIFLREPLSILKERFIQIVSINSDLAVQSNVNAEFVDNKTQITVINSDKMYNLFQTVLRKQVQKNKQQLPIKPPKKQLVLGQLCKRV